MTPNAPRDGAPGSRIKGSYLVRDYCASCGESIRVAPGMIGRNYCQSCGSSPRPFVPTTAHRPEGQAHGLGRTST